MGCALGAKCVHGDGNSCSFQWSVSILAACSPTIAARHCCGGGVVSGTLRGLSSVRCDPSPVTIDDAIVSRTRNKIKKSTDVRVDYAGFVHQEKFVPLIPSPRPSKRERLRTSTTSTECKVGNFQFCVLQCTPNIS